MPERSWIINGTYNQAVKKQIASIVVSVERRHPGAGGKKKKYAPTPATIRNDGTWVAVISGHAKKGNQSQLFAIVSFLDNNGVELRRMESAQLPNA